MNARPVSQGPSKWLHPTSRSDLQVTWHDEDDVVVISLWRGNECIATAPLAMADTASLTGFLVQHLGRRASQPKVMIGPVVTGTSPPAPRGWQALHALARSLRRRHTADQGDVTIDLSPVPPAG